MKFVDAIGMGLLVWFVGFCGQWCVIHLFTNSSLPCGTPIDRGGLAKACAYGGLGLVLFWLTFNNHAL